MYDYSVAIVVGTVWVILSAPTLRDDRLPLTVNTPWMSRHLQKGQAYFMIYEFAYSIEN